MTAPPQERSSSDNPHQREDRRIKGFGVEESTLRGEKTREVEATQVVMRELVFRGRVVTSLRIGICIVRVMLSAILHRHVLLGGLCAGEAVAAAAQQHCTSEKGGGEERTDGGKTRAFHGGTGLLA